MNNTQKSVREYRGETYRFDDHTRSTIDHERKFADSNLVPLPHLSQCNVYRRQREAQSEHSKRFSIY